MEQTREQKLRRLIQIETKYSTGDGATPEEYKEAQEIVTFLYPEKSRVVPVNGRMGAAYQFKVDPFVATNDVKLTLSADNVYGAEFVQEVIDEWHAKQELVESSNKTANLVDLSSEAIQYSACDRLILQVLLDTAHDGKYKKPYSNVIR